MKYLIYLTLILFSFRGFSQNINIDVEMKKIGFYPEVVSQNPVTKNLLLSKLDELILQNGVGDIGNNQFVLLAKINSVEQSKTRTNPPLYKIVYDIQLIIADILMKKKFGVYHIRHCIGINRDQERATINAMRKVQSNRSTVNWLNETKASIIDFYKNNCYNIVLEANSLSEQEKYNEAINLLSKMPKISNQCFLMAKNTMTKVFKRKNLYGDLEMPDRRASANITEDNTSRNTSDYNWIFKGSN